MDKYQTQASIQLVVSTIYDDINSIHTKSDIHAEAANTPFDPDGDRWPPTYSTGSKQLSIVAIS